jgi:hypothetical protein
MGRSRHHGLGMGDGARNVHGDRDEPSAGGGWAWSARTDDPCGHPVVSEMTDAFRQACLEAGIGETVAVLTEPDLRLWLNPPTPEQRAGPPAAPSQKPAAAAAVDELAVLKQAMRGASG